jgi:hypothetical protein
MKELLLRKLAKRLIYNQAHLLFVQIIIMRLPVNALSFLRRVC